MSFYSKETRVIIGLERLLEVFDEKKVPLALIPHIERQYKFQLSRLREYGMNRLAKYYEMAYCEKVARKTQ